MSIEVRPARSFADLRTMVGPKNPDANVCWCLSHRLESKLHRSLVGPERAAYVEKLTRRKVAPGVLAYDGDEVVGWAAIAPRSTESVSPANTGSRFCRPTRTIASRAVTTVLSVGT